MKSEEMLFWIVCVHLIYICGKMFWLESRPWQARNPGRRGSAKRTDALAQAFVESISYDRRMYKHDIAGSIAHATMLAKVGLITDAERDAIIEGLKGIERDIESGNFKFDD